MASSGSDSDSSHGSPSSPASFPSSHSSSDSSDSSSDSSDSSSSSSTMSLPSSTITVASVAEVRHELGCEGTSVQLKFLLAPDSSLTDAHELWGIVTADGGGESEFLNPDMLSNKEEAHRFVNMLLERLRRWKRKLDRKQIEVTAQVSKLKEVVDGGGPGVPAGYEPRCYGGLPAHIDITQVVDEEMMNDHIETIRTFLLQGSPATPTTDGDGAGVADCLDRELKEQLDVTHLNLEYLELKDTGLKLLSAHLHNGIAALEERFLKQRTHLGAGTAEFVRFVDVPI